VTSFSIRPATEADLPSIVDLFPRAFRVSAPSAGFADHLRNVLFRHPWPDPRLPSLACEAGDGRLIGFLGVLPRRMRCGDRAVTLAVTHHFMVDPPHRRTLAAVALLKAFFAGPQDLSLCEPDEHVCPLWEGLGGAAALLYSLSWVRYLRPSVHLARSLSARWPSILAAALAAGASVADGAARRLASLAIPEPEATTDDLDAAGLLEAIESSAQQYALRPAYALPDLRWLLDVLAGKTDRGRLRVRSVRAKAGERLGHVAYYARTSGTGEVLQVAARRGAMPRVVDALLRDASAQGLPALAGRLEPSAIQPLSNRNAIFRRRTNRLMYATSQADVERAILAGDAFLSRFETEWWIPFDTGAPS
jgi:hypothetical protein